MHSPDNVDVQGSLGRLRGFLVIFEIIQLIKLALVSLRRFMFSHTPREIRDMTKPANFEYAIGEWKR